VFLRLDTLEQPILAAYGPDIGDVGYRAAQAVARDNLLMGRGVVADCVNDLKITRDAWRDTALDVGATPVEIEIRCSDANEHRRRVETRDCGITGFSPPSWEKICAQRPDPWDREHLVVETAGRSVGESFAELLERLALVASVDRR